MPLGCGCLFLLGASVAPRLALLFAWLFTPYVGDAIDEWWMIILGILFLPFTTIMWVLVAYGVAVTIPLVLDGRGQGRAAA